jgi:hypothetical protein
LAYYEVNVVIGGTYDQIAVGITSDPNYPSNEFAGFPKLVFASTIYRI